MPNVMEKAPARTQDAPKHLEPLRQEGLWGLNPFGANLPRLLEEFWGARWPFESSRTILPLLDISEDDAAFKVSTELPGLTKEDVKIQFEHGLLTISGEKKEEAETKQRNWHRTERRYGSFCRTITLPVGVNVEKADAKFRDGVLEIVLPKTESAKPKILPIK